jgi:hypothetical protein
MLVEEIRRELRRFVDPHVLRKSIAWEKQYHEDPKLYGVTPPLVRKVASKYYQKVRKLGKREIFGFCEELLS